jgi:thiol:disulfide interchange protein
MRLVLTAVMAAGMAIAGCGSAEQHAPSAGDSPGEWIQDDLDAAMALAEESGKPLLMDLYADWCGPCRTLGEEYFPSEELQPLLANFVLARIDIDTPSGGEIATRYGVSSIPTVIIAEADGTEITRLVGTTPTVTQYAEQLQEIVDSL